MGTLRGHSQEVCGLRWSPHGTQLASGGNDNLLNIWDERYTQQRDLTSTTPLFRCEEHRSAVKAPAPPTRAPPRPFSWCVPPTGPTSPSAPRQALAWNPRQRNRIASGGGTADRMIRFWNTNTGYCLDAVDTQSQVCALQWSKHDNELVSAHGYSHNQLILWKCPTMIKIAELTGHTSRVLHMAQSPDGTTIVTAAADETPAPERRTPLPPLPLSRLASARRPHARPASRRRLRFWKILSGGEASKKEQAAASQSLLGHMNAMSIR